MLVRTWNLFHGNTVPPGRDAHLEAMVRLAVADGPDVVCLQEVPVWALGRLGGWSGMVALGDVAAPPRLGPFPSGAEVGRRLTALHHGLLRSAFTGQANALLVRADARVLARDALVLNTAAYRRAQSRALGLDLVARLAWAKERRVCQAVRLLLPDGRTATVANLHATNHPRDERLSDAELLRAAVFLDAVSDPADVAVLAGDFNVAAGGSRTLAALAGPDWGFSEPGAGVDHVLVRGAAPVAEERWPDERRRLYGLLLSDHAPVEARIP